MRATRWIAAAVFALATIAISCVESGYRMEVEPGTQGRFVRKKIEYTPEQLAERERRKQMSEPSMVEMTEIWSRLSESEKQSVLETARKLAVDDPATAPARAIP